MHFYKDMIVELVPREVTLKAGARDRTMTTVYNAEKYHIVPHSHHFGLSPTVSRPGSMKELTGGIRMSKKPRGTGKTLATWSSQDSLHHRWALT